MVESVETYLNEHMEFVGYEASMHCTAMVKHRLEDRVISEKSNTVGVITPPLSNYFVDGTMKKIWPRAGVREFKSSSD